MLYSSENGVRTPNSTEPSVMKKQWEEFSMELYIVLAIMAFMIIGFLLNKWPFGVTTMTCCVLLALTKVFTVSEALATKP